jgi:hypothetical protein
VLVRYGEPFRATPGEDPVAVTAELMRRIGVLLAEAQAAYPERPAPGEGWWLPAHLGGAAPTPEEVEVRLEQQAAERRRRARAEGEHDAA